MAGEKVLVIEDDEPIAKLVKYNLEKAGFFCFTVASGEESFPLLENSSFDLVILDIMLPQMDGFEVCKRIRQNPRLVSLPIIMLSARGEEIDRVVGLELGADDYMVKPFSPRELTLRARAVIKRGQGKASAESTVDEILVAEKLKLDVSRHKVTVGSKEVNLTAMEFKLLETLMRRRGRVQNRDQLLNDVWDLDAEVTTRTIDTHVKRLRQKLGKMGQFIETVRGHGYRFHDDD
jgi:two-component system, OmpR family, phosphate regulon response regulator PhoB